jgi:hypothetical protein
VSQFFPIAVGLGVGQREWACNAENIPYFSVHKFKKKSLSFQSFDTNNVEN